MSGKLTKLDRIIKSIKIVKKIDNDYRYINDNLIMYLSNGGESSPDRTGGGSPSYFVSRRRLMINPVNIKVCI